MSSKSIISSQDLYPKSQTYTVHWIALGHLPFRLQAVKLNMSQIELVLAKNLLLHS